MGKPVHKFSQTLMAAAVMIVAGYSQAASSLRLSAGRSKDVPKAGIRFRPFRKQEAAPMPDIPAYTYTNRVTNAKIQAFAPRDLWMKEQSGGVFRGPEGEIQIARLNCLLPTKMRLMGGKHIREEDYHKAIATKLAWTNDEADKWVSMYAGRVKEAGTEKGLRLRHPYRRYIFEGAPSNRVRAYVLFPPKKKPVFMMFKLPAHSLSESKVSSAIHGVLKSITVRDIKARVSRLSNTFQNRSTKGKNHSAAFEATRKRVIDSVKGLKDWFYVETPNYVLKSDLSSRNRRLVQTIQGDIEIMRSAYEIFIPPLNPFDEVSVVTVFAERKDYESYVPANIRWSGGAWISSRRELVISPIIGRSKKIDSDAVLRVVYHEAFHQYLFYALNMGSVPIWFNEGHAMLFEASKVNRSRKTIEVQLNDRRMKTIYDILKRGRIDLKQLMSMSTEKFYSEKNRGNNYASAWALTFFLRKAAHLYPGKNYDKVCDATLQTSIKTRNWQKGAEAGMKVVSMSGLQRDFIEFWKDGSNRRKAERYKLFDKRR